MQGSKSLSCFYALLVGLLVATPTASSASGTPSTLLCPVGRAARSDVSASAADVDTTTGSFYALLVGLLVATHQTRHERFCARCFYALLVGLLVATQGASDVHAYIGFYALLVGLLVATLAIDTMTSEFDDASMPCWSGCS